MVFMDSAAFSAISGDADVKAAHRDAWERSKNNPLFTGGDILADGMIIREIPEISVLSAAGASSADVSPVFMCGAQALGLGWASRTKTVTDDTDYKDKMGCAVQEIRGIQKLTFGTHATVDQTTPKDNGVFTGFFATPSLASA